MFLLIRRFSARKKKQTTFYWKGQFSAKYDEKKNDKYFTSWIEGEWDVIIKAKLEMASESDSIMSRSYSIKSVSLKIPLKYFCWEETNGDVEPIKYISEDYEITLDSKNFDLSFNLGNKQYANSFITESSVSQNDIYTYIKYIYLKYDKQEVFTTPKGSMLKLGGNNYGLYEGGFLIQHVEKSDEIIGMGTFPTNTVFQPPDGYNTLGDRGDFFYTFWETTSNSNCDAKVTFFDKEDTTRIVSGAAADGESKVVIQIGNLCDDVSKKDIKITISEQDGQLEDDIKIVDGVFTQTWTAPDNFVREGNADDLKTGKRELDFQITVKEEEVIVPDFYLFKPPVVLVHGIWADTKSFDSMSEYLENNYSDRVYSFDYPDNLYFKDNVATIDGRISGTINAVKNQKIEDLENPIVVKQADVIAHSMGGIMTGLYVTSGDYKNNVNRLITIGTPHSGSELANFVLHFVFNEMSDEDRNRLFNSSFVYKKFKEFKGASFNDGSLADLQVGSSAIKDYRKGWLNAPKVPVYAIQCKHPEGKGPSWLLNLFVYGGHEVDEIPVLWFCGPGVGLWYWDTFLSTERWYFFGADVSNMTWYEDYNPLNIEEKLFGSKTSSDFVVSLTSQRGGSSAYSTIEVVDHINETDDSEVQEKVAELLNSPIDIFDEDGFSPPGDYPEPEVGVYDSGTTTQSNYKIKIMGADDNGTGKLSITSPEEGATFSPGGTVTVRVSYDGQPENGIYFLSQDDGSIGVDDSSPYEYQFQINKEFIGTMLVVAWEMNGEGNYEEDGVEISVETSDKPESISITPSGPLYTERGTEVMLYVEGTYPDDVTRDITSHAAGTSYSSADSSIASVTEDGVITAMSVGETTITVENGASAEYKVYVLSCNAKNISVSEKTLTLKRGESENVTVTLTGNDGCLSEGKTVTTSINKAGQKRITISSTSTAVDSNGQAVFTITANNKKTGKAKVTFGSGKLKKSLTVKVTK